jgi:putative transposase
MTRKRYTEAQIIAVLKDAQSGVSVQDLCRKHGIADATFYKWRAKYAGLEVSDVKKLRQRQDEHRRLKQMVADQALDIQALNAITAKNWERPKRSEPRRSGARRVLGGVSDGGVGSWRWIAIRAAIAAGEPMIRSSACGSGRLRRAHGARGAPGSRCGSDGKAGG